MTGIAALNSLFLSWLPLAALPVLFHLFFRLKKQRRPFPTLMFFHRIDPKLNSRRRLREWLILLLRTLLILFLLLGLARPVWYGVGSQGTVAIALVIDNSGSMSGTGATGRNKLAQAVDAARSVISQLRPKDSAGIVLLVDDPVVPLPAGLTADKAALRNAIDRIGATEASGSVARAMDRATAMLENSGASRFEIHVLSDLQAAKWNQPAVRMTAPRRGTSVVIDRIPSARPTRPNVALAGVRVTSKTVVAGRTVPIEVRLANTGDAETRVRLNWQDDSGGQGSQEITVPASGDKTANLSLVAQNPGVRWATLWIEGDDFEADNHAALGFVCLDKKAALFVGGDADFGQLPLALSPGGDGVRSGLVPSFVDGNGRSDPLAENPSAFAVMTWDWFSGGAAVARWNSLKGFLERGGSALVTPPAHGSTALATAPEWLGIAPGDMRGSSNGLTLVVLDKGNAIFNDLRDEKGEITLRNVKAFKFCALRTSASANPEIGLEDGRVVLAEQRIGKGRLYASGVAFDSSWSTLTLKPAFVALAQSLALAGASAATNIAAVVAGETMRLDIPDTAVVHVQSLGGSALDWKGNAGSLASLPRSGVYSVRSGADTTYVAVRSSEKEGQQQFVAGDSVTSLGQIAYDVRDFTGAEALASELQRSEKSLDLSPLLLLLALATLIAEGWLANPLPLKSKNSVSPSSTGSSISKEHVAVR